MTYISIYLFLFFIYLYLAPGEDGGLSGPEGLRAVWAHGQLASPRWAHGVENPRSSVINSSTPRWISECVGGEEEEATQDDCMWGRTSWSDQLAFMRNTGQWSPQNQFYSATCIGICITYHWVLTENKKKTTKKAQKAISEKTHELEIKLESVIHFLQNHPPKVSYASNIQFCIHVHEKTHKIVSRSQTRKDTEVIHFDFFNAEMYWF